MVITITRHFLFQPNAPFKFPICRCFIIYSFFQKGKRFLMIVMGYGS